MEEEKGHIPLQKDHQGYPQKATNQDLEYKAIDSQQINIVVLCRHPPEKSI